jgi:hypothetical protein
MVAKMKKLTLPRLKGSLKLDPLKRGVRYKVDDSLLLDEYKDWNDYKKFVDNLKVRTYMLTMYKLNAYKECSKV